MNIKGMNKARILAGLYNNSKPLGMGILHYTPENMTEGEAQAMLDSGQTYFDYVKGRVMKIDMSKDELRTDMYNRDNGENSAEFVIESINA